MVTGILGIKVQPVQGFVILALFLLAVGEAEAPVTTYPPMALSIENDKKLPA